MGAGNVNCCLHHFIYAIIFTLGWISVQNIYLINIIESMRNANGGLLKFEYTGNLLLLALHSSEKYVKNILVFVEVFSLTYFKIKILEFNIFYWTMALRPRKTRLQRYICDMARDFYINLYFFYRKIQIGKFFFEHL